MSSAQDFSSTPPKKSAAGMLEKLGQRINSIKEDFTDNIERRRQASNQIHFIRSQTSEESLTIEKRPLTPPPEPRPRLTSHEESATGEKSFSIAQFPFGLGKKGNSETNMSTGSATTTTELHPAASYQDLFACDNREQAKEMIINGLRQNCHHNHSKRHGSETLSEDSTSTSSTATTHRPNALKLFAGAKFRTRTMPNRPDFSSTTIYPVAIAVGLFSLLLAWWKPISSFFSGILVGFLMAMAIGYLLFQFYFYTKINEENGYEWIDFADFDTVFQNNATKPDKRTNLNSCGEILFGRYDPDREEGLVRYPAVIRLDQYRLIIQLPIKGKNEKEMKFVGYREYLIKEANLMLVPERSLPRVKYWLNEYPIVLENLQLLDKQIINKQSLEKSKYDTDDFFNNPQTTLSLFFETCPEKEEWFYKLSMVIRKGKEEIERADRLRLDSGSLSSSNSFPILSQSHGEFHRSNTVLLDDRATMASTESLSIEKNKTETMRSQINETDIAHDINQTKKKLRKQDENLQKFLESADSIDEGALTLNFLLRRVLCDVFDEALFQNLMKEKIELKLKEIALTVLEDLHVETIDMGNTYPIILKVEPIEWNQRGLWFKLFIVYRGSFKTTIKTRIILKRLLTSMNSEPPVLYAQQHSVQILHKDDEQQTDDDETAQRTKSSTKETEISESVASKRLGNLLTKVASNKHFQRFAALKPVADVMEKLSASDVGVNIELLNISGLMTINIPPPPSDRVWIGFSEMPDLNLKVTPVFGDSKYSYTFIHDFLEARIRDEIKRLLVLPAMDDQLLGFMRDWVLDAMGAISSSKSPATKKKSAMQQSISEETMDF